MDTKSIRLKEGLSKYAFAKKLKVSWQAVHMWERGVWQPNEKNKELIREKFNV